MRESVKKEFYVKIEESLNKRIAEKRKLDKKLSLSPVQESNSRIKFDSL